MKPVTQDTDRCFAAAMASILEMPLDSVPLAPSTADGFWDAWNLWLRDRNLELVSHRVCECDPCQKYFPKGYAVLDVYSHSGAAEDECHAVVTYDGEIVHDPKRGPMLHPFGRHRCWYTLRWLDPSQPIGNVGNYYAR